LGKSGLSFPTKDIQPFTNARSIHNFNVNPGFLDNYVQIQKHHQKEKKLLSSAFLFYFVFSLIL